MKFTHVEIGIGIASKEQLTVALMNGKKRVGGTPSCSLEDALRAVITVFGTPEQMRDGMTVKPTGAEAPKDVSA